MMGEFGRALRQLRETHGFNLEQVSEGTRIRVRHISALESEQFQELPSDTSARGFVRLLARHLRADEQMLLNLFDRALEPHGPVTPPVPLSQTNATVFKVQPGQRHAGLGIGIGVVVLVLLFFVWMRASQEAVMTASVATETAGEELAQLPTDVVPAIEPSTATPDRQKAVSSSPASRSTEVADQRVVERSTEQEAGTVLSEGSSIQSAALPFGDYPLRLEFEASERSWIQAEVDGSELREALLQPGERIRWAATERVELTVGNAGGLTLIFNDETFPVLGSPGQVVRLRFTEEGLEGRLPSPRQRPGTPRTSPRPESLPPSALAF